MNSKPTSQRESVNYGSIISFRNELSSSNEAPKLMYYPGIDFQKYYKQKKIIF